MSNKAAIIIAPNWGDYAKKYLDECLDSIIKQDWTGESKIFMIDNESKENSYDYLKSSLEKRFSDRNQFEIFRNQENSGFAKGNNVAMKAAIEQGYEYLILFNMDTVVDVAAVRELIKVAEIDEKIGAVQARLMMWPDKDKINSLGNSTHFLGFGYCQSYLEPISGQSLEVKDIFYPSGAAVLFKAEVIKKIGYFDEEFWMYAEDQDIGWRIRLAGFRCVLSPTAIVYHKYEFSRSISRYYWMDRNRLIVILKNYHLLTLILIFPALLIMEFGLLLFALKGGLLAEKFRMYKYFLKIKNWKYIARSRQQTQKFRTIKDREIAKMIVGKIWYQEVDDWKLRAINPVFDLYWKILKKIIIW